MDKVQGKYILQILQTDLEIKTVWKEPWGISAKIQGVSEWMLQKYFVLTSHRKHH